jgi:NAD(P)-dependent dehydrogenase (short-subunit alcohol dehydrogenase family)
MSETQNDCKLAGKTAVVTGGSRGLGRGVVEALSAQGARVFAMARGKTELDAVASSVPSVKPVVGDAADEATAGGIMREARPDLLVLCAGASPHLRPIHEQTWQSFSQNWEVDARMTFFWLREALVMPMKPGSRIVVVSSGAALQGSPVSGGYAAAKRAQWFMADYASQEVKRAGLGLRIQCILPRLNASTELGRAALSAYAERAGLEVEEFAKRFSPQVTPAHLGRAVVELFTTERDGLAFTLTGDGLAQVP